MPRVKRGNVRRAKRKKLLAPCQGLLPDQEQAVSLAPRSRSTPRSSMRSSAAAARSGTSAAVGGAHQRRRPRERPDLRSAHRRPQGGRQSRSIARVLADLAVTSPAAFARSHRRQAKAAVGTPGQSRRKRRRARGQSRRPRRSRAVVMTDPLDIADSAPSSSATSPARSERGGSACASATDTSPARAGSSPR